MKQRFICSALFLFVSTLVLTSCTPKEVPQPDVAGTRTMKITMVDENSFQSEVSNYDGVALVLFYNEDWQSKDMEQRFELFAGRHSGETKFCKYSWDVKADSTPYSLEMLPTVVMYNRGAEVDRIRGIPANKQDRAKWNDDIDLWIMKNALGLKGGEYAGQYKYMFNNTNKLNVSNF